MELELAKRCASEGLRLAPHRAGEPYFVHEPALNRDFGPFRRGRDLDFWLHGYLAGRAARHESN